MQKLLFLCTGNYYRSRFAEEYFNYVSMKNNLPWRADSRGLRQNMSTLNNVGPISADTVAKLKELGVSPLKASRYPIPVNLQDFQSATRVIALCKREHRPMMNELFPQYENSIDYWDVEDLPLADAEEALSAIQENVDNLIEELSSVYHPERAAELIEQ